MDLRLAVSRTERYSDYFHFPLFPEETCYWLVCPTPVSIEKLQRFLPKPLSGSDRLLRRETAYYTKQKTKHASRLVRFLKYIPGLRFVALTGSVAAKNTKKDDDIDLMFITDQNALWLTRPLVLLLIALLFRRRYPQEDHSHTPNAFCPNLWLDTSSLGIPLSKQSLYTAHEVLQVTPLFDRQGTYRSFIEANSWTSRYLANAYSTITKLTPPVTQITPIRQLSSVICKILFAPLNYLLYLLQLLYMYPKRTSETVSLHSAFLHTADFSTLIDTHLNNHRIKPLRK